MNVAAEPLSRQLIRKITWKVREIAGCDDVLYFPIVHFIEWVLANPENDKKKGFEIHMELPILETILCKSVVMCMNEQ